MQELKNALKDSSKNLFNTDIEPEVTRPDERFGDYSTNLALQLAVGIGKNPGDIAQQLADNLKSLSFLEKVAVAGPGFLNFRLTDEVVSSEIHSVNQNYGQNRLYADQVIVAEYSDPNPFKTLHAGHLYTSIIGDAIAKLLENAGADKVWRVNFGGDVGLHVAKSIWAIINKMGGENPDDLSAIPSSDRPSWLSERYIEGNTAYEDNPSAKPAIEELNVRIYKLHERGDKESPLAKIYWTARQWSYQYFQDFYNKIGSRFDKYYSESETAPIGLKVVKEQLGQDVFRSSDGAIIFDGEKYGLHTRVFINSQGLPTYETKDIGLIIKKRDDYHFDHSIVITGNDIEQYMQVVLKAVEQFEPGLAKATTHLTHGIVKLKGEGKMSSRKGNIFSAEDVIEAARRASQTAKVSSDQKVILGAIKYSFLKHRIGADIIYDPAESVSLDGNSGPYLQYAHARARSIIQKAGVERPAADFTGLEPAERSLARKISEYPEAVHKATVELMPHHVTAYLYELAQAFNRFYETNRVIGDPRGSLRLGLVSAYAQVLKNGLDLLNIDAPEHM